MPDRLQQIYEVASDLFINKGYARTQIKDIAAGIGCSVGTMYHYFDGKADILSFIIQVTIDPAFLKRDLDLPMDARLFGRLDEDIQTAFVAHAAEFAAPYQTGDAAYGFAQMLSDAYDTIWQYGKVFLLIEKNPDFTGPAAEHYRQYRRGFFQQILGYVRRFQDRGLCRPVESAEYATQLMVETLAWWGMHVMNDAYVKQRDIPKETAKAVCLDALLHAYGTGTPAN